MISFLRRHERSSAVTINMTPMIDITFLLLTFFLLASHFASAEKAEVNLPRPDENQSTERHFKDKVIVNMLYAGETNPPRLQLGPVPVGSMAELGHRLKQVAEVNPSAQVVLRADRRLSYGDVRQALEAVAAARLSHLQVVTELGPTR